jgi:hypothetical protein
MFDVIFTNNNNLPFRGRALNTPSKRMRAVRETEEPASPKPPAAI